MILLSSLRSVAKSAREQMLQRLPRRIGNGSSLVLAYHNVVSQEDVGFGDRSLHLGIEQFVCQLEMLSEEADIVSLPDLLANHGGRGRRVAITFDDAYRGCLRLGIPACTRLNIKPTIFAAPALLGRALPWDIRSMRGDWSPADRVAFLNRDRGNAARHSESNCRELPDDYRVGSYCELESVVTDHAVYLGNHTMSHVNLARLTPSEVHSEVAQAQNYLVQRFPKHAMACLAYPYGIEPPADAQSQAILQLEHAFRVSGGWIPATELGMGFRLPRLNVPAGVSLRGLRAQVRGWLLDR